MVICWSFKIKSNKIMLFNIKLYLFNIFNINYISCITVELSVFSAFGLLLPKFEPFKF